VAIEIGIADPNDLANHIVRVVNDGYGSADLLRSIEKASLGDANDSAVIDERASKLDFELGFGAGNNNVQIKDASPAPVGVLDQGVLRLNFSTLLENGNPVGVTRQAITIDPGADASGAVLLIDDKQIAGGAAFDFDLFDLFGGTRSVMRGTLDVPTRPPYTQDFGTSGISTTERVKEWFSAHAKAYQDYISALSSGGDLFSTLITASFMSILTADLVRLKQSFVDIYTQQIIGTQGELYQLANQTFDANGRVTAANLTITLNPGMASAYTIEIAGWKQGDFGIRIENLSSRHGLDGGFNKNGQQDNWLDASLETVRTQLATLGFDAMDNAGGGGGIAARGANDPGIARAGNALANTLTGTAGDDNLYGDRGADTLAGGEGRDVYVFAAGDGADTITDLSAEGNIVRFLGGLDPAEMTMQTVPGSGGQMDLLITYGAGDTIRIAGWSTLSAAQQALWTFEGVEAIFSGSDADTPDLSQLPVEAGGAGRIHFDGTNAADNFTGNELAQIFDGLGGNDTIDGGAGNDTIFGGGGDDTLRGGDGDDHIEHGGGVDLLDGGRGNDTIVGGSGDIYLFRRGDGQDHWQIASTADIRLEGIAPGEIRILRDADTHLLKIAVAGTQDWILLDEDFSQDYSGVRISFDDGTQWSFADIAAHYNADAPTSGDDFIETFGTNDVLAGGQGNDQLRGDAGDDRYIWNRGDGNDTIGESSGYDQILLGTGITAADLQFSHVGFHDLLVTISGAGGGSIRIVEGLYDNTSGSQEANHIDAIRFANGTYLTAGQMYALYRASLGNPVSGNVAGTPEGETIQAGSGNDTIDGGGGGDTINGGGGNDTITGGEGYDIIDGGAGNDSLDGELYRFGAAFGRDTIGWSYDDVAEFTTLELSDFTFRIAAHPGSASYYDLVLAARNSTDTLTVDSAFWQSSGNLYQSGSGIFTFADGSTYSSAILQGNGFVDGQDDGYGLLHRLADAVAATINPMTGTASGETITGTLTHDHIQAEGGNDTINAGAGDDYVGGGDGNDQVNGQAGKDIVFGGRGNDTIDAGDDDDLVFGGSGTDAISGGAGADRLLGEGGADTIGGGTGNDVLFGQGGSDTYLFNRGDGQDLVLSGEGRTTGDVETLVLGGGITIAELNFGFAGTNNADLVITFDNTPSDQVTVRGFLGEGSLTQLTIGATTWQLSELLETITGATSGNDVRTKVGTANLVYGGRGNDTLNGSNTGETYVFAAGDGTDVVNETSSGFDRLVFAGSIARENLILTRQGTNGVDLLITFTTGSDSLLLKNQFASSQSGIESITFADGTLWGKDELAQAAADQQATTVNDTVRGYEGADVLAGGQGDDTLIGGGGDDEYRFALGDGHDTIEDSGGTDALVLGAGIEPGGVTITRSAGNVNDALLTISGSDGILLKDVLNGGGINTVVFADGTTLTRADIAARATASQGTAGNDSVTGTAENDIVDGGAGNDTLAGGAGGDSYLFNAGNGADTINETNSAGFDVVQFGAGISAGSVTVRHGAGNDLVIDAGGGNTITVTNHFAGTEAGIERIAFADGTTWSRDQIMQRSIAPAATSGNDTITGSVLNDQIAGGAGNDTLNGGNGADTYVFGRGDGVDIIADTGSQLGSDRIKFGADISTADVDLYRSPTDADDLVVAIRGSSEKLVVKDHFVSGAARIGVIEFADGSAWDAARISELALNNAPALGSVISTQAATQGQAFSFAVPAGAFSDADGETLQLAATLADGSPLPSWLKFDGTGFTGTPANGDVGTLHVRVTAKDAAGDSVSRDFDIGVANVNDAPLATGVISNQAVSQGSPFSLQLPAGLFVDPDNGLPGVPTQTITLSATLAGGQPLPAWLSFDANTGIFSGTPGAGDAGPVDIVVSASDGTAAGTTRFGISVGGASNHAPSASTAIDAQQATEDAPFSFQVPANAFADSDAGDHLRYAATLSDGSPLPGWLAFDAVTGTFSGTPLNGNVGSITVKVTASDIAGATATSNFTLNVVNTNDAPVQTAALSSWQAHEDQAFSYTVPAGLFSDVDLGDTLTYTATLADGSPLPAWLSFNPATRAFSGTPDGLDADILSIVVKAEDGSGASASGGLYILVGGVNDAPVAALPLADIDVTYGDSVDYTIPREAFTDEDSIGIALSAKLLGGGALPSWLVFDAATRSFSGSPDEVALGEDAYSQVYDIAVTATDSAGASVTSVIQVTARAPVLTGTSSGEELIGGYGPDKFHGGGGNDSLHGGAGGVDTFVFEGSFGQDTIRYERTYQGNTTTSVGDIVRFGTGIDPGNITVSLSGTFLADSDDPTILTRNAREDVILSVNGSGDQVTIIGQMSVGEHTGQAPIKAVHFANGTTWTAADIAAKFQVGTSGSDVLEGDFNANTLSGGQGSDRLYGSYGNDTLDGGTGNDDLYGASGDDTYLFELGSGQDRILDKVDYFDDQGGFDTLRFGAGITVGDLTFQRDLRSPYNFDAHILAGSLLIGIQGTSDALRIYKQYDIENGNSGGIDRFEFADGTVLTRQQMDEIVNPGGAIVGTSGADEITGTSQNDRINGLAGADQLLGLEGNDTYVWNLGDGNDVIIDPIVASVDVLEFGAGIDPADVVLSRKPVEPWEPPLFGFDDHGVSPDLFIDIISTGERITVVNGYEFNESAGQFWFPINLIRFANGTIWDIDQTRQNFLQSTSGNDTLLGFAGANDVLDGGAGNDELRGNSGADTYKFGIGYGVDTVIDAPKITGSIFNPTITPVDRVEFGAGITQANIEIRREILPYKFHYAVNAVSHQSIMTILKIAGTSDEIRLWSDAGFISQFVFTQNSTTMTMAQVRDIYYAAAITSGDDYVISFGDGRPINTGNGNDTIVAYYGDTVRGGQGNDTYIIYDGITVIELAGEGIDTIQTDETTTLADNFENLTLTGDSILNGFGNAADNIITGNAGDNFLDGAGGTDTLKGGLGDDTYYFADTNDIIVEQAGEGTDSVRIFASLTLAANLENIEIEGAGAINATGNAANNRLTGNDDDNILDGVTGTDVLIGRGGNDTYVTDGGDAITEVSGEGTDTVRSSATYTLGSNLENLVLIGAAAINGTGNSGNNTITGNDAANVLNGGNGNDTLIGGLGDDIYVINGGDTITEQAGQGTDTVQTNATTTLAANLENLTLTGTSGLSGTGNGDNNIITGTSGNNTLTGLGGNDTLNGTTGTDTLVGGLGDDTFTTDGGDTITEAAGEGTDTVRSSVAYTLTSNLENLVLTGTASINGTGHSGNNSLTGNDGNNTLNGNGGTDIMIGGLGDDIYVTDGGDTITELAGQDTDTVQSSATITLAAELENLTLTGSTAINGTGNGVANVLTGNSNNNTLTGLGGNDTLNGTTGTDTLVGGLGDDTYVTDGGDTLTEAAGEGTDTVQSSATIVLGANLEDLVLTGSAAINGTGTSGNNSITGNGNANTLDGGGGTDTLTGGLGNDIYVTDGGDTITELAGQGTDTVQSSATYTLASELENLTLSGSAALNGTGNGVDNVLTGNSGNNTLTGLGGNDTLNGTTGTDTLVGGLGDDTYVTDGGDTITELAGEGTDTVQSAATLTLGANLENLTLSGSSAINGTGNAGDNTITGNGGNNTLDGGGGTDTLVGGLGNDIFVTDGNDTITEAASAGTDTVQSAVAYTLGTNLENLTLTGSASINGTGNTVANILTGNSGANTLDGGTGADAMTGAGGNDIYVVDNTGDTTVEAASGGTDLVQASVNWTLSSEVENLTLTGSGALNGTGNALINTILGNSGANIINGAAGNDVLTGGSAADIFVFDSALNATTNIDQITDYNVIDDTIRLENAIFTALTTTGTLAAAAFVANTSGTATTTSHRVIYETDTGKLFYDSNGSTSGGSTQFATLAIGLSLTNSDFVVI
jgi:Ca2+-binding RTX toxin-like protein